MVFRNRLILVSALLAGPGFMVDFGSYYWTALLAGPGFTVGIDSRSRQKLQHRLWPKIKVEAKTSTSVVAKKSRSMQKLQHRLWQKKQSRCTTINIGCGKKSKSRQKFQHRFRQKIKVEATISKSRQSFNDSTSSPPPGRRRRRRRRNNFWRSPIPLLPRTQGSNIPVRV